MADVKISEMTDGSTLADGDLLPIVDVSDTTQAPEGSTKKFTLAELRTGLGSMTPAAHASSHVTGGSDIIASAQAGLLGVTAAAGLMSIEDKDLQFASRMRSVYGSDFENGFTAGAPFTTLVSGASAANNALASEAGHHGILQCVTGSTTTGRAGVATGFATAILPADGEIHMTAVVRVPTLSTAGEEFAVFVGCANTAAAPITRGFGFYYDRLGNGTNWRAYSDSGGAGEHNADSGIVVNAGQWYRLDAILNAAGTQCDWYIDGVLVSTASANLPSATIAMAAYILKSAGSTTRPLDIDLFAVRKTLTTPR